MRRARRLTAVTGALLALVATSAQAQAPTCPGATAPSCPYTAVGQVGQRDQGVLRFPQTVAVGPDGAVYVGDQLGHVVQVFNPDGSFRRAVGIAGTRPGELGAVGALAVGADNTLYVADGNDRIDRFDADGRLLGSWGGAGSAIGRFSFGKGGGHEAPAGGGLAVLGDFVYVSDSRNDRVQRFNLDGTNPVELIPPGVLDYPRGLTARGNRLVVADDHHHRIAMFDLQGNLVGTSGAGRGTAPGQFDSPFGVAFDDKGRVFVADDLNHRVVRLATPPTLKYRARWGSYGTGPNNLAFPRAIAADAQGQLYVTNTGNDRIDVFDASGTLLRSFGRSGRGVGQFDGPVGVAADASGLRAVADSYNGRVVLLAPGGTPVTAWGSPNPGPTILPEPVDVAFDPAGNGYVLDQSRGRILVFDRATGLSSRSIAVEGTGPGQLFEPSALEIDATGVIWVGDSGNDRIARFTSAGDYLGSFTQTGVVRGLAVAPDGSRVVAATSDSRITVYDAAGAEITHFGGRGTKLGKLGAPGQMALDAAGNLWVADRGQNRVQQFGPDGERLQSFGVRGTGPGEFLRPTGVAVDCQGLLTVTDTDGNRVQQFQLAAPAALGCGQLGPLGTPPAPKTPTLPEPLGPQLTFRVLRSTSALSARGLPLRVGCDTACTVTVTGTVSPRGAVRGRRTVVRMAAVVKRLGPATTAVVRPRVSAFGAAQLRRALRRQKGLTVDLEVTAVSQTGQETGLSKRLVATR